MVLTIRNEETNEVKEVMIEKNGDLVVKMTFTIPAEAMKTGTVDTLIPYDEMVGEIILLSQVPYHPYQCSCQTGTLSMLQRLKEEGWLSEDSYNYMAIQTQDIGATENGMTAYLHVCSSANKQSLGLLGIIGLGIGLMVYLTFSLEEDLEYFLNDKTIM